MTVLRHRKQHSLNSFINSVFKVYDYKFWKYTKLNQFLRMPKDNIFNASVKIDLDITNRIFFWKAQHCRLQLRYLWPFENLFKHDMIFQIINSKDCLSWRCKQNFILETKISFSQIEVRNSCLFKDLFERIISIDGLHGLILNFDPWFQTVNAVIDNASQDNV